MQLNTHRIQIVFPIWSQTEGHLTAARLHAGGSWTGEERRDKAKEQAKPPTLRREAHLRTRISRQVLYSALMVTY